MMVQEWKMKMRMMICMRRKMKKDDVTKVEEGQANETSSDMI